MWDFYSRWFSTAFTQTWIVWQAFSFIAVIIGDIIMLRLNSQKNLKLKGLINKLSLYIPLGIFIILLTFNVVFAPYIMYQNDSAKYSDLSNRIDLVDHEISIYQKATAISLFDDNSTKLENRSISLSQYGQFSHRILKNCYIFGSPTVIYFDRCTISHCSMDKLTSQFVIFSPELLDTSASTIIFNDCVISNCVFNNVIIIGADSQISEYKTHISTK